MTTAKQLALSFDDGVNPQLNPQAYEINKNILYHLSQKNIHAIIYPALNRIGDYQGLQLIADWGKQGHRIGNHSMLHLNLNKDDVELNQYISGISQADIILSTLPRWVARYRFPYLKEGNTVQKRDGVRQWLNQRNYQSGAVTIDASDWYYNQLYLKYQAINAHENLNKLRQAYVCHLLERAKYYDDLAQHVIGRSPKHVLLLHVNAINAAWLDKVISAFQQQGWQFINSDHAYADPIYQRSSSQLELLPAGESLIWSLAKIQGNIVLRYPAEDAPYEYEHLKKFGLSITE